ncbi:hypothetical protein BV25DRAFT_1842688 [Artomyces pyxidatus]|uniref:Uncharacterized protein n=1 Tax=Artomyces pyxidatus TaxID=48021 RepID=A0ACB8SHB9_9AGAM|nr:hypothetical protein BV25DRAFT_1842688 [Artomyces pyxidatus]
MQKLSCQKAAWDAHKPRCVVTAGSVATLEADEGRRLINEDLGVWLQTWTDTIYQFSLWAMNLANRPYDTLSSHSALGLTHQSIDSVVLYIASKQTCDTSEPARRTSFKVIDGTVMSDDELFASIHNLGCSEEAVAAMRTTCNRDLHTCQIAVICEEAALLRFAWVTFRNEEDDRFRRMGPSSAQSFQKDWVSRLAIAIEEEHVSKLSTFIAVSFLLTMLGSSLLAPHRLSDDHDLHVFERAQLYHDHSSSTSALLLAAGGVITSKAHSARTSKAGDAVFESIQPDIEDVHNVLVLEARAQPFLPAQPAKLGVMHNFDPRGPELPNSEKPLVTPSESDSLIFTGEYTLNPSSPMEKRGMEELPVEVVAHWAEHIALSRSIRAVACRKRIARRTGTHIVTVEDAERALKIGDKILFLKALSDYRAARVPVLDSEEAS